MHSVHMVKKPSGRQDSRKKRGTPSSYEIEGLRVISVAGSSASHWNVHGGPEGYAHHRAEEGKRNAKKEFDLCKERTNAGAVRKESNRKSSQASERAKMVRLSTLEDCLSTVKVQNHALKEENKLLEEQISRMQQGNARK